MHSSTRYVVKVIAEPFFLYGEEARDFVVIDIKQRHENQYHVWGYAGGSKARCITCGNKNPIGTCPHAKAVRRYVKKHGISERGVPWQLLESAFI